MTFVVRDTGVGMSREVAEHIFDPFYRDVRTGGMKGTGLGLAITKGYCQMMGGTIEVESEEGEGTTFTVKLPAVLAPVAEDAQG